jgi:hypothetical protein
MLTVLPERAWFTGYGSSKTKRWQDTHVTFLKDKIHTLCKLANDLRADALTVELDYKVKDAELYRELALKILNRNQYLGRLERTAGA